MLTEDVARQAIKQGRGSTIKCVAPDALAAVIDEYAILGPELSDRLASFPGVSLSKHLVEIAFEEGLNGKRHAGPRRISRVARRRRNVRRVRLRCSRRGANR